MLRSQSTHRQRSAPEQQALAAFAFSAVVAILTLAAFVTVVLPFLRNLGGLAGLLP